MAVSRKVRLSFRIYTRRVNERQGFLVSMRKGKLWWYSGKTTISNVSSPFLKERILKKNEKYQSFGIEIIPDISFFRTDINGDWRRRNHINTFKETLYSLEIKASERANGRIAYSEIETDLLKLKAQTEETERQHNRKIGAGLMIIDVAPKMEERITVNSLNRIKALSKPHAIDLWYFSQDQQLEILH